MFDYLTRRIDEPRAWAVTFGASLAVTAALLAYREYGLDGALLAALAVGAGGAAFGWVWGSVLRLLFGLSGGLDRPVRRPDRWGMPLRCTGCEWRSSPEGPWLRRDCLQPPITCPQCDMPLSPIVPDCPECGACAVVAGSLLTGMWSQVRWPRTLESGLWGHHTCRKCRCCYDKWGRK